MGGRRAAARARPPEQVGASVRDPEKARDFADRGVRVRRGDFGYPDSLGDAFEGASRVLIVSVDTIDETAVRRHRAAIDAAKAAGACRIVYTSHIGVDPASPFPPMADHAATEAALRDSGVAFTALRNGYYAATASWLLGDAPKTGELAAPEDGPIAYASHADLAEAAAYAMWPAWVALGTRPPHKRAPAVTLVGTLQGSELRRISSDRNVEAKFALCPFLAPLCQAAARQCL